VQGNGSEGMRIAYTVGWCTERLISDLLFKQGEQTFRCADPGYIYTSISSSISGSSHLSNVQSTSAWVTPASVIYHVRQNTAPFYFCNGFVRTLSIKTIFGTHILQ